MPRYIDAEPYEGMQIGWGNGFTGGFDKQFNQLWNGSERSLLDDLQFYGIKKIEVITPEELNEKRGFHKPTMEEYLGL